jgi:O-antigen/teichoic acid export membrane protein
MNENKKIAINSIIIFIRLCIVSVLGLIIARWTLLALGASDFGLYNVVGGIVLFLNIMGSSMTTATHRYLAYEIGRGTSGEPRKVFNTSLTIHAIFAIIVLLLGLSVGLWYVNNYLNVEYGRLEVARFVLIISIVSSALSALKIPCDGLLIAYEKFQVAAIVDIIVQLIKLGLIYYLLHSEGDRLVEYSIIMLIITIAGWGIVVGYCICNYWHVVKPKLSHDFVLYKEMFFFSVWIMYGALAAMGKKQGTNMIINFFFGTLVNAAYAVATQIENYILMFARSLNNAAIPQITKGISGGNTSRSINLASYISKYTFFLMLLIAFPLILEMDFILELWLKDVPEGTNMFCILLVISGLIGCLGEGIPPLVQALGKVRSFTLVISTITLLGLPMGWWLYKLGFPSQSMLFAFIVLDFVIAAVRLLLLKRVLDFDIATFIKTSYLRILYVSIPLVIIYFIYSSKDFPVWGHVLGLFGAILCVIISIGVFGIDNREKNMIQPVWNRIRVKIWKK